MQTTFNVKHIKAAPKPASNDSGSLTWIVRTTNYQYTKAIPFHFIDLLRKKNRTKNQTQSHIHQTAVIIHQILVPQFDCRMQKNLFLLFNCIQFSRRKNLNRLQFVVGAFSHHLFRLEDTNIKMWNLNSNCIRIRNACMHSL